jgi:hypothetical protein
MHQADKGQLPRSMPVRCTCGRQAAREVRERGNVHWFLYTDKEGTPVVKCELCHVDRGCRELVIEEDKFWVCRPCETELTETLVEFEVTGDAYGGIRG